MFTSSTDVADFFGKQHKHVLRDIDNIRHGPNLDHVWFQDVKAQHPVVQGRFDRTFDLTCDPFTLVIHGAAAGADSLAGEWAEARGIPIREFPPDWTAFKNRRSVGPIRNAQMLAEGRPDLVVAFAGARGTAGMVRLAREAAVQVIEVPERQ